MTSLLDLDGYGQRSEEFRFDVLDGSGAKIGEVTPEESSSPTITNNTTSAIMRSLDGFKLSPADGEAFQEVGARIRPSLILQDGSEGPLGVFRFISAQRLRDRYGVAFDGAMLDDGFLLDQPTTRTVGYDTGYPIDVAIFDLFLEAGVPGLQMDATSAVIGSPVVWPPSTSIREIVAQLAAKSGRLPAFFDNSGVPRVILTPDLATAPVVVRYRDGLNIGDGIVESNDLLNAPNRFLVVCTSATNEEITGFYDLPDSAPNSFHETGARITKTITEQGLADTAAAQERARTAAVLDSQVYQHAAYSGAPDYRHDTFQVHEFRGDRWFEQSWTLVCVPGGSHGHLLQRIFGA